MKAVVQRVKDARVEVDGQVVGAVESGLLVYLGVQIGDSSQDASYLARKISNLRIFRDENDKMNLSVKDVGGQVLAISQFTLCADMTHGNRPSFDFAAKPPEARELYERFAAEVEMEGLKVEKGIFGAHMHVFYENDGPVTILYDTKKGN